MKMLIAVIRPEKLEDVKTALDEMGAPGMMVEEIKGHGRQGGIELEWRVGTYRIDFLPKVKIMICVQDDKVDPIIDTIVKHAGTGEVGDGKVFVLPVEEVVRIRTGERGSVAV